jgi:diacylglycerol kinase family enzyme
LPEVFVRRGSLVEAEAVDRGTDVRIEIDGEPLGKLPARYELLPAALTLRGIGP